MKLERRSIARALAALSLLAPSATAAAAQGAAVPSASAPPHPLERVVVLGASASAGFGLEVSLADALDALIACEHEPVRNHASETFFLAAESIGPRQIEAALAAEPTLVVAIDFLFWFGYGMVPEEERLERLERGIAQLERLGDVPLLVATIPWMGDAVQTILPAASLPAEETLLALNERIELWAAERDVAVLELPMLLDRLRSGEPTLLAGEPWPEGEVAMIQGDALHPTLPGMVALGATVGEKIAAHFDGIAAGEIAIQPAALLAELEERSQRARAEREAARQREKTREEREDGAQESGGRQAA